MSAWLETLNKLTWLALAGAFGTLARVGLATTVSGAARRWAEASSRSLPAKLVDSGLPVGTAFVNVLGCSLFGLFFAVSEGRFRDVAHLRPFILGGFMGAFTTFSTYQFETVRLLEQGRVAVALANLVMQNSLGMGALAIGLSLGKAS